VIRPVIVAAGNNTDAGQTIRIEYAFDGPGTELDRTFTDEVTLPARDFVQSLDGIRVQNGKTPIGEYTLTVTVTGGRRRPKCRRLVERTIGFAVAFLGDVPERECRVRRVIA
jgi:hypothetical protein